MCRKGKLTANYMRSEINFCVFHIYDFLEKKNAASFFCTSDRATWEIYFLNGRSETEGLGVLEKRIASVHHYSDCSAMNSHTRVSCNFSNCGPLYPPPSPSRGNTFHDHMALDIEGYLISVNRFYRRWKYWKHFRLLRDFGRVVFQVDIKLQRSGVIFQYAPTDRCIHTYTPTAASTIAVFSNSTEINPSIISSLNWIIVHHPHL